MNHADYIRFVTDTRVYKKDRQVIYPVLGFVAEHHEVAVLDPRADDYLDKLLDELGDVSWMLAALEIDLKSLGYWVEPNSASSHGQAACWMHISGFASRIARGDDMTTEKMVARRVEVGESVRELGRRLASYAHEHGFSLDTVRLNNYNKITARQQAGTIKGIGEGVER